MPSQFETKSRSEKHFILLECLYLWLPNQAKRKFDKNNHTILKKIF